jgi:Domain of unknown function (DU1801)
MPENKTKATQASVRSFIAALPKNRRADAKDLVKLMESVSCHKPKIWGTSIIGFGSYHYRYDSGREGDMPLLCFSPRKSANVIYNMGAADKSLLERLGKHALSGSCLHITKLSDVDPIVLKTLVAKSFATMRASYDK